MKKIFFAAATVAACFACKPNTAYKAYLSNPLLYSQAVHQLNQVVMGNNFPPIIASRNYTYAAIAGYEAMAAAYPSQYNSLAGQLHGLQQQPPRPDTPLVIPQLSALLAYIKVGEAVTFPEGSMTDYRDSIITLARANGLPKSAEKASIAFADTVAAIIIAWSKGDNYAKTRGSQKFSVLDSPGRWQPTPPMYAEAVEPNWRQIRPLVMDSATQFPAAKPIPFNIADKNSPYYKQVMAVKNAVDSLTDEQKHIANFWDDNPFKLNVSGHVMFSTKKFSPPGHWMGIVGIAAKQANFDFAATTYAYAMAAIAGFDAFIQCWDAKFKYNTVRPETVINKYIDPNWRPLLQTPAFPEYTCGHSTTSAASAEALTAVFGHGFAYTDTTELEFGIASRRFSSFRQAADENNWARFYGGIHFHPSCIESTNLGQKVGALVVARLKLKK
ncbi:MAG: phosphoesterase PA-phosphatase [Bacteroidetes bacterium]|nr:MAG: phosphoesterase PA-phosphatase [Bacteroidota bacterium]